MALGFCEAHYRTYPYVIYVNRLLCSPLTETQFLVLNLQALNAYNYTFWAHPVDTEKWHSQEHFEANIEIKRDCFNFSKVNIKKSQGLKSGE